jgi:hypothetical protein
MRKSLWIALALLWCGLPAAVRAQEAAISSAPADSLAYRAPEKNFTRAALEVTGANVGIWLWCRYVREGGTNTGFRIGIQSWKENLLNGFEWDDNQFKTNQLAHPYHGSMYFCAARANGFDYWESIPFAFAGSIQWEYFGEVHHPSINDWISTSVGGTAVGEMLHRFSNIIVDQQATGSERTWREIGGVLVNPMGGINRLITGDMTRVGPNPPDWNAFSLSSAVRAGARITGEGSLSNNDTTRAFFRFRIIHGDPTGSVVRKPYDAFSVDLQVNPQDVSIVGRAQVVGVLHSWETHRDEHSNSYFAFVHNYDYIDNWAYKIGAQSIGASLLHRHKTPSWTLSSGIDANWIILGGTSSDYASYTGRTYDYGPGAGGKYFAALRHRSRSLLAIEGDYYYLRVLNGTPANHFVCENRVTASVPLYGSFNLGAEYSLYHAERHYRDFDDVSRRAPQLTAYLSLVR